MPLTNEEFAKLEKARAALKRVATKKTPFQLAVEHLETMTPQLHRAVGVIDALVRQRNNSWCYRVPRFFAIRLARINLFATKWQ